MMNLGVLLAALAALAAVLGLIWGGQAVVGRRLRPLGRRLQLAETIALDARRRLHLVRCDNRFVLLQTGGTQDVVVGWLSDPPQIAVSP